jgi:hypothetical protein
MFRGRLGREGIGLRKDPRLASQFRGKWQLTQADVRFAPILLQGSSNRRRRAIRFVGAAMEQ